MSGRNEVIHLLNVDGSLLNVRKETAPKQLITRNGNKVKNGKRLLNFDEYFQTVLVYKCIKCNHLCEERADMIKHITEKHLITIENVSKLYRFKYYFFNVI